MVNAVHEGYLTWPELSKPVLQYRLGYSKVCEGCVQKCTLCYSCLVNQDVKEELDDDHDHENEIDKKFDEASGAKLKYN